MKHSSTSEIIKPLTKSMFDTLQKIYEHQQLNLPPLDAGHTKSSKGLLLRGLIELQPWFTPSGKEITSLHITQQGIEYVKMPILKSE